jgi:hypothetical protein
MSRVTFDTNVLEGVIDPAHCAGAADHAACVVINTALQAGAIQGFFSEACVVLDALGKSDKIDVVGSARIATGSQVTEDGTIVLSIGTTWKRTPIHPRFLQTIHAALAMGLHAMLGPRRFGDGLVASGFGDNFYEPYDSPLVLVARGEMANKVLAELAKQNLGRAPAVRLGLEFSARDNAQGELWLQGLGRARDNRERKKVRAMINEWADGETIAAHVGHGNRFFCTHDRAGDLGQRSALHPTHRAWLAEQFGISFVSRSELAEALK